MERKKANLGRRIVASLIDGVISLVIGLVPLVGGLVAAAFMLTRDGLFDGQSPGKRIMGLKVVSMGSGREATYADSIRRNAIFAIPDLVMVIPVIGVVIGVPLAVALFAVETVFVLTDPRGLRLGDRFGRTMVVDAAAQVGSLPA